MNKLLVYAGLAVGNSLVLQTTAPATRWDWYRYILQSIIAGFIAAKAYQSDPKQQN